MKLRKKMFLLSGLLLAGSLMVSGCTGSHNSKTEETSLVSATETAEEATKKAEEAAKKAEEEAAKKAEEEAAKKAEEEAAKKAEETAKAEEEAAKKAEEEAAKAAEATVEVMPVVPNDEFVRVRDYIPDMVVDLKYATTDNFTGEVIYDFSEAYLRYGTVMKLKEVQDILRDQGMSLKIWDAFRPVYAQERLWEVYPDPVYVANPANGVGGHCLGGTIDITIVYADGSDLEMPTGFDDFSVKANRDYSDCSDTERENALLLQNLMYEHGFSGYSGEWWDFTDNDGYYAGYEFTPPADIGI